MATGKQGERIRIRIVWGFLSEITSMAVLQSTLVLARGMEYGRYGVWERAEGQKRCEDILRAVGGDCMEGSVVVVLR